MKRIHRPKYVVLDQNVVSDPGVVGPLHAEHRRSRQRIVLSASSRYEMTKGGLADFLKQARPHSETTLAIIRHGGLMKLLEAKLRTAPLRA